MLAPTVNGGKQDFKSERKSKNFKLSISHDLESGHMPYSHASFIEFIIHTKFHSNPKKLFLDGLNLQMDRH